MHITTFIAGLLLILATLLDAFETILLPRRISHRFRYSRLYYRNGWRIWRRIAARVPEGRYRESMLSVFGPFSLLGLFGSWILSLVLAFAAIQWSVACLSWIGPNAPPRATFTEYLYYSGQIYFTLGLGDVVPIAGISRALTVAESGLGFAFLAIIISYLPVLYQAFSKREVIISLMDARAGSPPTGGEIAKRLLRGNQIIPDNETLREWEHWCAELLESHLSFPVLAYYRSQHANQSWLTALTAMLDSTSLLLTVLPVEQAHQARLTFAMARHAAVDIALIFNVRPQDAVETHSSRTTLMNVDKLLAKLDRSLEEAPKVEARLEELRAMYEPFLQALAKNFMLVLPPVVPVVHIDDNWQRSAWMGRTPGIDKLPSAKSGGDHFD